MVTKTHQKKEDNEGEFDGRRSSSDVNSDGADNNYGGEINEPS